MAKRLRLTPPQGGYLAETGSVSAGTELKPTLAAPFGAGAAPIARVAADAAASAAFEQVSDELRRARVEGRLIQALPLDAVVQDHLVRDRVAVEPEELASLCESIRARGQQTPIEVVDLGQGRYGLISGWRRLAALRRLLAETGDARFATVLALLRTPADAASAYVSMVEENEIRVGLSYYERARIVAKAVEQGVFQTPKQALQSLFSTASRAKRSKIGSFLTIVAALDGTLRHPTLIGERTGLALAQALEADMALADRIKAGLAALEVPTAEAEQSLLAAALRIKPGLKAPAPVAAAEATSSVQVSLEQIPSGARILLTGEGVTPAFHARLVAWLALGG
jgi:ParB/RepB/Spo0J family partition protein